METPRLHILAPIVSAVLLAVLAGSAPALAQPTAVHRRQPGPVLPDPCTDVFTPGPIDGWSIDGVGSSLRVFAVASVLEKVQEQVDLILIVNGNGYQDFHYAKLVEAYAHNGFVVATGIRQGSDPDPGFVLDALDAVIDSLNPLPTTRIRIGLLGHSRGGSVVIEGAVLSGQLGLRHDIRAVVGLSPHSADVEHLDGTDTPALLVIYGSQDEDLRGDLPVVSEGFGAYDKAGTEGTTTCNAPPCIASEPAFEKTMIHAYGFDHAGLIGHADSGNQGQQQDTEYISAGDQLCVTRAYTTAFFRWRLMNQGVYKGFLRDEWRPASLQGISSFREDLLGTPIGTPLQLFFQISPAQRRVIENFENGTGSGGHTSEVVVEHHTIDSAIGAPHYVRHQTNLLEVRWPALNQLQQVNFRVPETSRIASTYSHFSIRLGQLHAALPGFENPAGEDQSLLIILRDGHGKASVHDLDDLGRMPPPDPSVITPTRALSFLTTYRIPVEDIVGIDLNFVTNVLLVFRSGTSGSILVDNMEWHRD